MFFIKNRVSICILIIFEPVQCEAQRYNELIITWTDAVTLTGILSASLKISSAKAHLA